MADAVQVAPAQPAQPADAAQQPGGFQQFMNGASKMILLYLVFNWLFGGRSTPAVQKDNNGRILPPHVCMYPRGQVPIYIV